MRQTRNQHSSIMSGKSFVDKSLIHLKDKIHASANDTQARPPTSTADHAPANPGHRACPPAEFEKAVRLRRGEFKRLKADLHSKLGELLSASPAKVDAMESALDQALLVEDKLKTLAQSVDNLDDSGWGDDCASPLADAMKTLENVRMELLTLNVKTKILEAPNSGVNQRNNFAHEIASLSAGQLLRLGILFHLPAILGILFASVVLAVAIYISMRA